MPDRFVWVTERGMVRPERWYDDSPYGCVNRPTVAIHVLAGDELGMTLDALAAKYPVTGE